VIHIHGTKDKLFPIHYCQADITIERGSHFMVLTHARQISMEMERILQQLSYHL
jgi:hypothetical protein